MTPGNQASGNGERGPIRGRPGFTLLEVIMALFLASVGMLTVFGIQVAANLVQRHARDINAARMLGESIMTRLRSESINWTRDLAMDCTQADMPMCWWALQGPRGGQGVWVPVPRADFADGSPRYNALGIPDDPSDTRVIAARARVNEHNLRYCVSYNLDPVGETVAPGELLRAQIRVFWPATADAFAPAPTGVGDCDDPAALAGAETAGQFRSIQLNSVLYRHEDVL